MSGLSLKETEKAPGIVGKRCLPVTCDSVFKSRGWAFALDFRTLDERRTGL